MTELRSLQREYPAQTGDRFSMKRCQFCSFCYRNMAGTRYCNAPRGPWEPKGPYMTIVHRETRYVIEDGNAVVNCPMWSIMVWQALDRLNRGEYLPE